MDRDRMTAWLWWVLPVVGLVVLHLVLIRHRSFPIVYADELGYLGHARYLAGLPAMDLTGAAAYAPGYSVLIAPAFWLAEHPAQAYRYALYTNALLLSLMFVPLRGIVEELTGLRGWRSAAASLVACLYPAVLLQTNMAQAESAFMPLFAAAVWVFARLARRPTAGAAAMLGLLVPALVLVHARALAMIPLTLVLFALLGASRRVRWSHLGLGAGVLVATHLLLARWNDAMRHLSQGGRNAEGASQFDPMLEPGGVLLYLAEAAGQAWYLLAAPLGLVAFGALWSGWRIPSGSGTLRRRLEQPEVHTALFVLGSAAGIFAASSVFLMDGTRGDHMVYGRYNEGFVPVLVALGAAWLAQRPSRERRWGWVLVTLTVMAALAAFVGWYRGNPLGSVNKVNVLAILTPMDLFGSLDLGLITALSGVLLVGLVVAVRWAPAVALTAAGALFLGSAWHVQTDLFDNWARRAPSGAALARKIRFAGHELQGPLLVDRSVGTKTSLALQFFLHEIPVEFTRHTDKLEGDLVVAPLDWPGGREAVPVAREPGPGLMLWRRLDAAVRLEPPEGVDVRGAALGTGPVKGVLETGFHPPEHWAQGRVRWTRGLARLWIPVRGDAPEGVYLDLGIKQPGGTDLVVRANGSPLLEAHVDKGSWRGTLPLPADLGDVLVLEIDSDTHVPAEVREAATDRRVLGVLVREIRLVDGDGPAEATP